MCTQLNKELLSVRIRRIGAQRCLLDGIEVISEHQGDDGHELHQDVECGARSILRDQPRKGMEQNNSISHIKSNCELNQWYVALLAMRTKWGSS